MLVGVCRGGRYVDEVGVEEAYVGGDAEDEDGGDDAKGAEETFGAAGPLG